MPSRSEIKIKVADTRREMLENINFNALLRKSDDEKEILEMVGRQPVVVTYRRQASPENEEKWIIQSHEPVRSHEEIDEVNKNLLRRIRTLERLEARDEANYIREETAYHIVLENITRKNGDFSDASTCSLLDKHAENLCWLRAAKDFYRQMRDQIEYLQTALGLEDSIKQQLKSWSAIKHPESQKQNVDLVVLSYSHLKDQRDNLHPFIEFPIIHQQQHIRKLFGGEPGVADYFFRRVNEEGVLIERLQRRDQETSVTKKYPVPEQYFNEIYHLLYRCAQIKNDYVNAGKSIDSLKEGREALGRGRKMTAADREQVKQFQERETLMRQLVRASKQEALSVHKDIEQAFQRIINQCGVMHSLELEHVFF